MLSAQTEMPGPLTSVAEAEPVLYAFEGESFEVVDMHLHTGSSASMHPDGVSFLLSALPAPTVLNFPATSERVRDPYDPHVGIKEHLRDAGVGHGVLLATYTHHTIGYTPNRVIEAMLDDARNVNPDGSRWSWGMASINFEGYEEPGVAEARLEALASYFQARPDLFIGIKLAHAHQAVSFDDPAFLGVYDIAAEYDVEALAICTVSDDIPSGTGLSTDERATTFEPFGGIVVGAKRIVMSSASQKPPPWTKTVVPPERGPHGGSTLQTTLGTKTYMF